MSDEELVDSANWVCDLLLYLGKLHECDAVSRLCSRLAEEKRESDQFRMLAFERGLKISCLEAAAKGGGIVEGMGALREAGGKA